MEEFTEQVPLTGQEVESDIAIRLRNKFSQDVFSKIYKDKPVQSIVTPCAFIHSIETTMTSEIGEYAWWNHLIDIRCHPGKLCTNIHSWARTLAPQICDCVQQLTINEQPVKCKEVSWRVENDVLHVIVSYKYRVIRVIDEEEPSMETLIYKQQLN